MKSGVTHDTLHGERLLMTSGSRHPLDTTAVDAVWERAAAAVGLRVRRDESAYASSDGRGNLHIGARHTLDADDSLAQLVFHELCHAVVQGEDGWTLADWGLDNTSDRDEERERACLRVQAHLAAAHGLRDLMAPTTVVRPYYESLPPDPVAGVEPEAIIARAALARARPALLAVLREALAVTAAATGELDMGGARGAASR